MLKPHANYLAAIIAALACSGALAQQAGNNGATPQVPVAPSATAPSQQGVVYPGRQMVGSSGTAVNGATLPGSRGVPVAPAAPGTPINQAAGTAGDAQQSNVPQMPPLGSPSQQYVDDNMPADLAKSIREYKKRFDEAQRASAEFVKNAPKPKSSSITITQAPGELSPTVRLSSGIPTNVVFTDASGAPWPIEFATPGDTSVADVLVPVEGSSTLQIRPKQPYMYGAVSVNLRGNNTPITLILASAQNEVDTRLDIRLARRGPNAQAPIIDRPGFTNVDAVMLSVLDGVPPSDAQAIKSSNSDLRAWNHRGKMYVRTTLAVVSPAYSDTAASVDGTRVYIMPSVPFVTVSVDGVLRNVRIGE
jgi:intracellular multiplication protein IcmK